MSDTLGWTLKCLIFILKIAFRQNDVSGEPAYCPFGVCEVSSNKEECHTVPYASVLALTPHTHYNDG